MGKFMRYAGMALFVLAVLMPSQPAAADIGPKPGMEFQFVQEGSGPAPSITSGTLYECDQPDCSDAEPLKQLGPQGFSCQADHCSALSYGFSPYHRLEIQFSDGVTRSSNVFKTVQFDSSYTVTIRQSDLIVKGKLTFSLFSWWTYALICGLCLVGLILIAVVVILVVRRSRK